MTWKLKTVMVNNSTNKTNNNLSPQTPSRTKNMTSSCLLFYCLIVFIVYMSYSDTFSNFLCITVWHIYNKYNQTVVSIHAGFLTWYKLEGKSSRTKNMTSSCLRTCKDICSSGFRWREDLGYFDKPLPISHHHDYDDGCLYLHYRWRYNYQEERVEVTSPGIFPVPDLHIDLVGWSLSHQILGVLRSRCSPNLPPSRLWWRVFKILQNSEMECNCGKQLFRKYSALWQHIYMNTQW
jgi:hypothetical protein